MASRYTLLRRALEANGFYIYCIFVSCLLLVGGCSHKKPAKKRHDELLAYSKAQEALFADIEIPWGVELIDHEYQEQQSIVSLTYRCHLSPQEL
ncbi:MAG TPA: hypothetical protein VLG71_01220, partial [Candidatus Limnocylindria bacterium]|nr:hypothetical protein [Candidatus Limnocylindria bacterium]